MKVSLQIVIDVKVLSDNRKNANLKFDHMLNVLFLASPSLSNFESGSLQSDPKTFYFILIHTNFSPI